MNALIFDVESNGKAKNFKAHMTDLNNWPRITQLAWEIRNVETGDILKQHQSLIFPDGWTIPTVEELTALEEKDPLFFERNNMSTERCMEEGNPIAQQLSILVDAMQICEYIVAHNSAFDVNVVGSEMIRIDMSSEKKLIRICTMESSTKYCNLPGGFRGQAKWPKLEELYFFLFNETFDGAHDALVDVTATGRCFIELIKRGIINLPIPKI